MESCPTTDGKFIMHAGGKGAPTASYVQVLNGGTRFIINLDDKEFQLTADVMHVICSVCCDRKTIVFFQSAICFRPDG